VKKNKDEILEETEEKGSFVDIKDEDDDMDELNEEEEATDEVSELKKALQDAEDKLMRQAAEAENYRKRLIRETDDKIKYANQSLMKKFLPVLDNFDLALKHTDVTVEAVLEGVSLNRKAMLDILAKEGLELIPAEEGDAFDLNLHEGLMLSQDESKPNNSISMVIQNGYRMEGRIVRPVKVQVNKI
jgi:molecular chaperone GrpE